MKTLIHWHLVLIFCLVPFSACKKASRSLEKQHGAPLENIPLGGQGDQGPDKAQGDQGFKSPPFGLNTISSTGNTSEVLSPHEPLRPLGDMPPRGPKFVPPPVDPYTGGPIVPPPPPPPPPGLIEDDILPVVPFFTTPICGNDILTAGKQCEDGNVLNGDGCSLACKKEYCGNGLVEVGEQCDNGAGRFTVQGPDCDEYCQFIICGDSYVTGKEECDDGNQENCDGCSSKCQVESPTITCGNTFGTKPSCPCAKAVVSDDDDDAKAKTP